jgi:hypothetical protein
MGWAATRIRDRVRVSWAGAAWHPPQRRLAQPIRRILLVHIRSTISTSTTLFLNSPPDQSCAGFVTPGVLARPGGSGGGERWWRTVQTAWGGGGGRVVTPSNRLIGVDGEVRVLVKYARATRVRRRRGEAAGPPSTASSQRARAAGCQRMRRAVATCLNQRRTRASHMTTASCAPARCERRSYLALALLCSCTVYRANGPFV